MRKHNVAIIVPLYGKLDLTKRMLDSLNESGTDVDNFEATTFFVDNCSPDDTALWLAQQVPKHGKLVAKLLPTNTGFAGGVNAGLRKALAHEEATGEAFTDFLVANNDILIPKGTIHQLLTFMDSGPGEIGVVGPMSNMAGGQQCWDRGYGKGLPDGQSLEDYAAALRHKFVASDWDDRALPTFVIVGLFFLMSRRFFTDVGFFDERYYPGMWEESDYCLRGKLAGYKYFIDKSSFVWHEGNATMKEMNLDVNQTFTRNRTKYVSKWLEGITEVGKEIVRVNREIGPNDPELPVRIALQKAFYR